MTNDTAVEARKASRLPWGNLALFISFITILLLISALGYGYWGLSKNFQHYTSQQTDQLNQLQRNLDKWQDVFAQQEKRITKWQAMQKDNLHAWYVAEAEALVKLASDTLQFNHNKKTALLLLQRAEQILKSLPETDLLTIRKALATDVVNLQALPQIDVTALYLRINALNAELDQLPLPSTPLKPQTETAESEPTATSWWRAGLARSWQKLRQIVVVRKYAASDLPLVLPDEKVFLYQNLHAQVESMLWAVLHHNQAIYQANLARILSWVNQYFDQDAAITKTLIQHFNELSDINVEYSDIQVASNHLAQTIALFADYLNKEESSDDKSANEE